jgi:hypothetical protein
VSGHLELDKAAVRGSLSLESGIQIARPSGGRGDASGVFAAKFAALAFSHLGGKGRLIAPCAHFSRASAVFHRILRVARVHEWLVASSCIGLHLAYTIGVTNERLTQKLLR